jgi:DNA-nicking Smr family endonuclease
MTRKRDPENEDVELWKQVTETVAPLKGRQKPATDSGDQIEISAPISRPAFAAPPRPAPAPANLSQGPAAGLDRRTARRLKRGQLFIDGRIDLHGHTLDQAQAALTDFILRSRGQGKRCLLVITGKGTGGTSVIRAALPGWLGGGAPAPAVLAFCRAQPKDGGGGAFYVLLRKKQG